MAERTKANPTGAPLTVPPPTARRAWGRVLVGRPIPIADPDAGVESPFAVRYDLDRVMGWTQHSPAILADLYAAQNAVIAASKARKVAFADQWSAVVSAHYGTTTPLAEQVATLRAILSGDDAPGAQLADVRRLLGPTAPTPPDPADWAAYEAALDEHRAANQADNDTLAAQNRAIYLATIADVVVALGVPATTPGGEALGWDTAEYGPRPDPRDPATWADVPDLILSWLCNAGMDRAQLQVDSFRLGRPSVATSRA